MDINKLVYDVESHPLVTAIVIFVIFFVGFQVLGKKTATAAATTGTSSGIIPIQETYYNMTGSVGATGAPGITGATGATGAKGATGAVGPVYVPRPIIVPPEHPKTPVVTTIQGSMLGAGVMLYPNRTGNGVMYYRSTRTGGRIVAVNLPSNTQYTYGSAGRSYYKLAGSNDWHPLTS